MLHHKLEKRMMRKKEKSIESNQQHYSTCNWSLVST